MKTQPTPKQVSQMLARIGLGVLEAAETAGDLGAPGGVLYAAMQAHGATLNQFQSFMGTLTRPGYLELDGDYYRITQSGLTFKARLVKIVAGFPTA
jgi:hypothetical protein